MKLLSVFFLFFNIASFSQSDKNPCETLEKINRLIAFQHYKSKPIDDSLSVYVFSNFMETLDEDSRLFLENEITLLKKHQYQIDDYIIRKDCSFLDEIYTQYQKAIDRYEKIIATISNAPYEYQRNDTIRFSRESFPFAKEEQELLKIYQKSILFNVLKDVAEVSQNKDSLEQNFDKIAPISKNKILETFRCKTDTYRLTKAEFYSLFYNSFCTYFDPHTNYFSQSDRSSFLSGVSADNLTFGFYVSLNENNEIIIESVIPGSSAYETNKINSGDIITKVRYEDKEYQVACSSLKKIEEIFISNKCKKAEFTIRKKTGEIVVAKLVKKVMKDYQNNVYSFLLQNNDQKIGYIKIPSFYSTFEDGTTNVSDDLVKELYKLKEDQIDGLLLDLEDNGGGSMDEAVRLTGLFVDFGPIAVIENSLGKKEVIKDYNRGTAFPGPLVLLINGNTASASEFFTNAIQDYNRGIVVGSQSHGKASMQRIYPLENDKNPTEFLKMTIEKFYRITGKTNQEVGITPDVTIPLLFDKQLPREKDNRNVLANDSISVKLKYEIEKNNYAQIIERSRNRIRENTAIKAITELNSKINALYDNDFAPIALQFNTVFDEVNKVNTLWKEIAALTEKEFPIEVSNSTLNNEYQNDEYLKSASIERIKAIKQNIHIVEALNIFSDLKNQR